MNFGPYLMDMAQNVSSSKKAVCALADILIPEDERIKLFQLSIRWSLHDVALYALGCIGVDDKNQEVRVRVGNLLRELGDIMIEHATFSDFSLPPPVGNFKVMTSCEDPSINQLRRP